MARYSARARRLKNLGKHSGPNFIQLFHYVKRSTAYHALSPVARALLIELIDRYNGSNNGMIVLGVREAEHELGVGHATICRAMRELDDADLARPLTPGAWRGRHATEWRLTWRLCNKTGDLPRRNWQERKPYCQLLLPKPAKEPLSDAERARRYRRRKAERHENRHDEVRHRSVEGPLQKHRRDARSATEAQNGNSSITSRNARSATEPHVHIYQALHNERYQDA